ncbi:MAG: NAD(P)-dependent oxidoreductase [archaeon]
MKRRIFVTGATGFIGKHLVNELISQKMNVVCLIRKKEQASIFRKSESLKFLIGEIKDTERISKQLRQGDIVVHLANISDGLNYEDFYKVNVKGTKNLVLLCEKIKIKKFIFLSSTVVLGNFNSPYTETKRLAEDIVKKSSLNYVILRPDMVYGINSKRHILDLVEEIKNKKVKIVFGYQHVRIRPVYIGDVARAIINSIKAEKITREVYNIISEQISYGELFKLIKKRTGSRCLMIFVPRFFALFLARTYTILNKNSTLYDWIKGNEDKPYDLSESTRDLGISPIPISKGLDILLKS